MGFRLKGFRFQVVGLGAKQTPLDIYIYITAVWRAIRNFHMNCLDDYIKLP